MAASLTGRFLSTETPPQKRRLLNKLSKTSKPTETQGPCPDLMGFCINARTASPPFAALVLRAQGHGSSHGDDQWAHGDPHANAKNEGSCRTKQ